MPDVLYMSATPIPRTYALTLYGDMDVSSIKSIPNGRKKIITKIKKMSEIRDVLEIGANLDERIADGVYMAKAINLFEDILQNPELFKEAASEKIIKEPRERKS